MMIGKNSSGKLIFASARDIGNIGAGYMAGRYAIPWAVGRKEFDRLESKQQGYQTTESISSQSAQLYGYRRGVVEAFGTPYTVFGRYAKSAGPGVNLYRNRLLSK